MLWRLLTLIVVLGSACVADAPAEADRHDELPDGLPDEANEITSESPRTSAAQARFELPERGVPAWGDVPFPSELYRTEQGALEVVGFPNPKSDGPVFGALWRLLNTRSGYCTTCNFYFRFDGAVDAGSLDAGVVLVEVGGELTDARPIPLRLQYDAEAGLLSGRPQRGHVLRSGRPYVAFLTTEVRGFDGLPLSASDDFARIRDGKREILAFETAFDALERLGYERTEIVNMAVFTTDEPRADLDRVRELVVQSERPVATIDRVWSGAELDELMGVPADQRPGLDRPPAAGSEGDAAVRHQTTAFVVSGTFRAPRLLEGTGTDVGVVRRDSDGRPVVASVEDVPFVLIIPKDADLTNLPVAVAHHGFSASRTVAFVHADTAGRAGWAVLAIDAYQHGARAKHATDRVHGLRGELDGPDGFSETKKLAVTMRVFGLAGVPAEQVLSPDYPLSAFTQFSADALSALRFVREGDVDAIRAAAPELERLAFDPHRSAYVGNSMGAVVGAGVTSVEPTLDLTVLNVMPGSIVETLAESAEFRRLSLALILPVLGVADEFDEQDRSMLFDPTVDMFRWAMEPVDPLALAPSLGRANAEVVVQLAGHDEVAAPRPSQSVVEAARPSVVTHYDGMHGMLEVSAQASQYAAPLVPPFEARPEPVMIDNPIDAVHDEIEAMLKHLEAE